MLDDRQCRLKISIKIFLYVKLKASFLGFYDISKKTRAPYIDAMPIALVYALLYA